MPKISLKRVGWGSYLDFEGPYFKGDQLYKEPTNPSWGDHILTILQSTEGGAWNAYNGYDRCISTSGLIQWCEAGQYSVSDMLGLVAARGLSDLRQLDEAMNFSKVVFKKNARGNWRFHFLDARGEVDRTEEQKQLFLLNSNGLRGSWDDLSKTHAKLWAACISSVWTTPEAIQAQKDFTVPRLNGFMTSDAKAILHGPGTPNDNEGWVGALRAGYLSYAANLPAVASAHLKKAVAATKAPKYSPDWCIAVLKQLAFGPQIAIYPHRYQKIRPVLERLFDVDLPDFAEDLKAWKESLAPSLENSKGLTLTDFDTIEEYQTELIAQGYDLGPAGADGVMGKKTKAAIVQFQQLHRLVPDGIVGMKTRTAFLEAAISRG